MNFTLVYNENYNWVLNLINSRINNYVEAEELANDIFLKIHKHLHSFDENKCETGLLGWIRSITYNKLIDHYRKKKLNYKSLQSMVDDEGRELYPVPDTCNIEADYCRSETIERTKYVISLLPDPYKTVSRLFFIDDYTYDEIAQETGLALGTVKGQLSRARNLIKTEMGAA